MFESLTKVTFDSAASWFVFVRYFVLRNNYVHKNNSVFLITSKRLYFLICSNYIQKLRYN